jgi:protein TonB
VNSRIAAPELLLPWHTAEEEDRLFGRILRWCLLPFVLVSLAIPLINTPEPEREELDKLPPQLARVVLEKKELPKPPPVVEKEPAPEELQPEEPKPEKKARPEPEPKPAQMVEQAREKARQSGVLQFSDDLAAMRDSVDISEVSNSDINRGKAEAAEVDRALIASRSNASSGGIDTSALSRDTGGLALSGRETTRVESKLAQAVAASSQRVSVPGREQLQRSDEEIRKIMDLNKSAIFAIYNRALRRDPTLEGRVIVKMVIEPGGVVSSVKIISSDLSHEDLESKVLARIRMIDFGTVEAGTTTVNYTFDFLPT